MLKELMDDDDPDVLALEREALGLYISGHPLDGYDYSDGTLHIAEVAEFSVGVEIKTVGLVAKVRDHTDRNGGLMTFVTIEDATDRMEVTIFASAYRGDLEAGAPMHLHGQVDQHEPLKAIAIDYEVVNLQSAAMAA